MHAVIWQMKIALTDPLPAVTACSQPLPPATKQQLGADKRQMAYHDPLKDE